MENTRDGHIAGWPFHAAGSSARKARVLSTSTVTDDPRRADPQMTAAAEGRLDENVASAEQQQQVSKASLTPRCDGRRQQGDEALWPDAWARRGRFPKARRRPAVRGTVPSSRVAQTSKRMHRPVHTAEGTRDRHTRAGSATTVSAQGAALIAHRPKATVVRVATVTQHEGQLHQSDACPASQVTSAL